jgi:hypothetical protein
MTEALELIPLPKSLNSFYVYTTIKATIKDKLAAIPELKSFARQSVPFCKLVCDMVENIVPRNNQAQNGLKIDKKQLVMDVCTEIFELNPLE